MAAPISTTSDDEATLSVLFVGPVAGPYLHAICLAIRLSIAGGHGRDGQGTGRGVLSGRSGDGDHLLIPILSLCGMISVVAQT